MSKEQVLPNRRGYGKTPCSGRRVSISVGNPMTAPDWATDGGWNHPPCGSKTNRSGRSAGAASRLELPIEVIENSTPGPNSPAFSPCAWCPASGCRDFTEVKPHRLKTARGLRMAGPWQLQALAGPANRPTGPGVPRDFRELVYGTRFKRHRNRDVREL